MIGSRPFVRDILDHGDVRSSAVALRAVGDGESRVLSYQALREGVLERADRLRQRSIGPGQRVVIFGSNSPEWLISFLAVTEVGAAAATLDVKLNDDQLQPLFDLLEASAVFADEAQFERLQAMVRQGPILSMKTGDVLGGDSSSAASPSADYHGHDVASIVFTSGSTALPKGVMLTADNFCFALRRAQESFEISTETELLCVIPLTHVLGLGACLACLREGGTTTLLSEPRGDLIASSMREFGVTMLPGPPRLFEILLGRMEQEIAKRPAVVRGLVSLFRGTTRFLRRRLSINPGPMLFGALHRKMGGQLEAFISGGAALPDSIRAGLESFGFHVFNAYGLTETTAGVSCNCFAAKKAGTVGKLIEGAEVKIANPDARSVGEIWVRGPMVMAGYFRDPEATSLAFSEGWYRTGDLGASDHDGFLRITGRIKDIIVTAAGKNVSPEEVEWLYRELDGVAELAVVGMPSQTRHGEEVHAAVVVGASHLSGDTERTIQGRFDERSAHLPTHLRIQKIHVVNEIPRTTTLKVRRSELKKILLAHEPAERKTTPSASGEQNPKMAAVIEVLEDLIEKRVPIAPSSVLVFDLGLDSLGLMELATRLSARFSAQIDLPDVMTCKTVEELTALVDRSPQGTAKAAPEAFDMPPPRGRRYLPLIAFFRLFFKTVWGMRAEGLANVPKQGPFILCANHQSYLDFVFTVTCLSRDLHSQLCVLAKGELFDNPKTRWITVVGRALQVDRFGDPSSALEAGRTVLESGRPLFVHPEGTRTRDGRLQPFRRGVARLALQTGVPLIPVRIEGAYDFFPPHKKLPKLIAKKNGQRVRLRLWFGEPIQVSSSEQVREGQESELTDRLAKAVASLGDGS